MSSLKHRMTITEANAVFDILVEHCHVDESRRDEYVTDQAESAHPSTGWRFDGIDGLDAAIWFYLLNAARNGIGPKITLRGKHVTERMRDAVRAANLALGEFWAVRRPRDYVHEMPRNPSQDA